MKPEEEVAALKEATRQAHEVLKDLRNAMREAKVWHDGLKEAAQVEVDAVLVPVVNEEVRKLGEVTKKAMDDAVERVNQKFDELADLFLKGTKKNRRSGGLSLEEMIGIRGSHED